jgi:tRNA threonylcarbamoyladenosine biosynthesis protein TsaE
MTFKVESIADMAKVATAISAELSTKPIVLLKGAMGSGKTTLVTLLMEQVDPSAEVSSPTYSIVQIYDTPRGKIYHFDLYRLAGPEELLDFGFDEYLDSGNPCLIEWPEIAGPLLPEEGVLRVDIALEDGIRTVSIS